MMHGMFYVSFVLFLIVTVETALIINYMTLSQEQPAWWWRVWWSSAAIGVQFWLIILFYSLLGMNLVYYT